ncbi:MAG: T9SS type A sorting domain-containing protein [Bacteroidetes bacterium]|nr:T9SS type A sorting domain-containing protein [Bacteroidota bacterium]
MQKILVLIIVHLLLFHSIKADYWTQKADFGGLNRADATGFSSGTKGYLGTGFTSTYATDWWEYDQPTNTWTQKANYGGTGIVEAAAFSIGSKGYVLPAPIGNELWQYDPILNSWTQMALFPGTARQAAVAFSIDTKGYIATGASSTLGASMADLWEYDSVTNSWMQKTDLPGPARHYATGFAIGTKGYVGTGISAATSYLNDFWEWDKITDTWSQKADFMGTPRLEASGFALNGKGYIGMGTANGNYYFDFYQYDPISNTWSQKADFLGGPREEATQFSIGNLGYVGTGYDGMASGVLKKDFWEYHPEDSTTSVDDLNDRAATIDIFPNPFSSETQISFNNELLNHHIEYQLFDNNGRIVKTATITENSFVLQRRSLAGGTYLLRILADGKSVSENKIVITK